MIGEPGIIYWDDHLVVVNKPAGMPSHATPDPERIHAEGWVSSWLEARGEDNWLHLAHRLDAATSGVLLMVRSRDLAPKITDHFKERQVEKAYRAICGRADGGGNELPRHIDNFIAQVRKKPARWGVVRSGGQRAQTDITVLESFERTAHLRAMPLTGRTHQIRVHLSGVGFPIIGDRLYGGGLSRSAPTSTRLLLHAESLILEHPVTRDILRLMAPLPPEFNEQRFRV